MRAVPSGKLIDGIPELPHHATRARPANSLDGLSG